MVQILRPISDFTITPGWTTPAFSQVNEVTPDDSNFIECPSPVYPAGGIAQLGLPPAVDPQTDEGFKVRFRLRSTGVSPEFPDNIISMRLHYSDDPFIGATVNIDADTITEEFKDFELEFPSDQVATIIDFSSLVIRFGYTDNFPGDANFEWSWVEVEIPSPPPVPEEPVPVTINVGKNARINVINNKGSVSLTVNGEKVNTHVRNTISR